MVPNTIAATLYPHAPNKIGLSGRMGVLTNNFDYAVHSKQPLEYLVYFIIFYLQKYVIHGRLHTNPYIGHLTYLGLDNSYVGLEETNICGTVKCVNSAKCVNAAKCIKINVSTPLNVSNQR